MWLYVRPWARSSPWRPRSTIRPRSMTQISSACATVDSRWAMTIVVRPSQSVCSAFWIACFGFRIERRSRLVQQDDRRVLEEGARDGDALALAAGELHAVLAAGRVVALLEAHDEVVGIGRLGGRDDVLLARAGAAHGDIVAHRALEQEILLRDIADLLRSDFSVTVAMSTPSQRIWPDSIS